MKTPSVLRNVRSTWRRHGLPGALRAVRANLRGERLDLFVFAPPGGPVAPEGAAYRFADAAEAEGLPEDRPERARQALGQGDRCLLQLVDGRLAGYVWVAMLPAVLLTRGLHLGLRRDLAYSYKTYTVPEYRGRGLRRDRHHELLRRVQEEGRRALLFYVAHDNFDSLKRLAGPDYRRVGMVRFRAGDSEMQAEVHLAKEYWPDDPR